MSFCAMEGNSASAARQSGCFAAHAASFLRIIAGIALAVSVLFFADSILRGRLCLRAGLAVIVVLILLVFFFPGRRKK